jgi:hypothetical protein
MNEADQHDRDARESFERSDTDGFLSQWASGLTAERKRLQASIVENDGMAEIGCVVDADDRIVPARWIDTRFGGCFALFEDFDSANNKSGKIIEWISESKMERLGYRRALCLRPAKAEIVGTDAVNCRAVAVPNDDLLVNPDAEVVAVFDGHDEAGNAISRRLS